MNIPLTVLDKVSAKENKLEFEILIDESFTELCTDGAIITKENKHVRSIINDFEDGKWSR